MKKSILSAILILCFMIAGFGVSAQTEESQLDKAYKALSHEIMTSEVYYAISENITLDSVALCEKMGVTGVDIAWESSDENIMDTTGKITKTKYQNQPVTLTATLTDGTDTLKKSFDFTVLSEITNVYFSENFYYPEYNGDIISNASTDWSFTRSHDYTETTGGMTAVITERGEDTVNYALKGYRKGTDQSIHYTKCNFPTMASGKVAWETDIYLENDDYSVDRLIMFDFYGKYDNGKTAQITDFRLRIDSANTTTVFVQYYEGSNSKSKSWVYNTKPMANNWSRVRLEFDTDEQVYDIFINGKKINSNPMPFYEKNHTGYSNEQCDGITSLNFGPFRSHKGAACTLDDFVLYDNTRVTSENPEVYTVADKIDFSLLSSENIDSVTENLDLSLSEISDVILENSVNIEWESSNSDVLQISGDSATVTRGIVTEDVVLTAKLSHPSSSYVLRIDFNVSVLADEDYINVNRVIDNVRSDYLTTEPSGKISRDLDLSTVNMDRFVSTEGVSIKWESSNESVMDNYGTVTRGKERENVFLTMTVTDDLSGYMLSKIFDFTVLAEDEYVYYSNNFSYPEYEGMDTSRLPNWSVGTVADNYYTTVIEKLDDGNYVQFSKRDVVNSADYGNFTTLKPSEILKNKITYNARFKFEHSADKGMYMFYVNGKYKGSTSTTRLVEITFNYTTKRTQFSYYEGDSSVGSSALKVPPVGEWFDLTIEFDVLNQSYNLYINGELYTRNEAFFVNRCKTGNENKIIDGITNIQYNSYRYTANNRIYCDEVSVIGKKGIHQTSEFFIDGTKVRNLKTMPYYNGSEISGKQLISNETYKDITVTPVAAVYKNNKLTEIKKGDKIEIPANSVGTYNFGKITLPDTNLENVEIRTYAFEDTFAPNGEKDVIKNNAVMPYEKELYYDGNTGRTVNYIDVFGDTSYKPYFNAQAWSADSQKLYIQTQNYAVYEYDTFEETLRYIDDGGNVFGLVTTPQNKLIYINKQRNIVEMDCGTYEKRLVGIMPENQKNKPSLLTVSNDGKKLLLTWSNAIGDAEMKNEYYRDLPILDMESGEWDLTNAYGFVDNVYWNPGINPAYPNLILLNHGAAKGATFDRNWVYNTETKTAEYVFKQKPYSLTQTGETHSHETWSYDGENLFIDKAASALIGYGGVMSFDKDGNNRRHINDDYSYCHLGVNPANKRWVVSDTAYGAGYSTNNIVLIDTHSGKSYLLAKIYQTGNDSVGHCHPAFSPDGQKVYFGMNNSDYSAFGVGYIDVSDLVNMPDELEILSLSDSCTAESYPGTDHEIITDTKNGVKTYKVSGDNILYVNYVKEELEDAVATIEITYFDDEGSFELCYYDWIVDPETHNELKEMSVTVTKENTGKWVTKSIEIEDINLENMEWFGSDFKLKNVVGDLIVKSVNLKQQ